MDDNSLPLTHQLILKNNFKIQTQKLVKSYQLQIALVPKDFFSAIDRK